MILVCDTRFASFFSAYFRIYLVIRTIYVFLVVWMQCYLEHYEAYMGVSEDRKGVITTPSKISDGGFL